MKETLIQKHWILHSLHCTFTASKTTRDITWTYFSKLQKNFLLKATRRAPHNCSVESPFNLFIQFNRLSKQANLITR